jgi:hypothetical protein
MEVYQFTYDYISAIFGNNIDWKKKKKISLRVWFGSEKGLYI